MDRKRYEDRRRIGSVKTAVNIYGEMILDGNSSLKKPQEDSPEPSSRVKQLHRARRDKNRYKESRKTAESELFSSRGTDKDLAFMVEEPKFKAKSRMSDIESLRKNGYLENKALDVDNRSLASYRYDEVMRELQVVKKRIESA